MFYFAKETPIVWLGADVWWRRGCEREQLLSLRPRAPSPEDSGGAIGEIIMNVIGFFANARQAAAD